MFAVASAEEELARAGSVYRQARLDLDTARGALAEKIVEAAKAHVPQTQIVQLSGYTREHVRRICRAAGVEPEDL
jgi:hypothetical protein